LRVLRRYVAHQHGAKGHYTQLQQLQHLHSWDGGAIKRHNLSAKTPLAQAGQVFSPKRLFQPRELAHAGQAAHHTQFDCLWRWH
jgi:hypothetical protein